MQMQSQRANATVHAGKGSRKAAILERYQPAQGSSWMWGLTGMTWKPTNFDRILWPSAFIYGHVKQAALKAALSPCPSYSSEETASSCTSPIMWRHMAMHCKNMQAFAHQIQAALPYGLASLCVSPHIGSLQPCVLNVSSIDMC